MSAPQESIGRQASETFHLLVDSGQQFREDYIQFLARGVDDLMAETADLIIEAARRHKDEAQVALQE